MKIKTQIKLTYNLKDAKGCGEQIDKAFYKMMEIIGAKWYAQGVETKTDIRDICYDLEFPIREDATE